MCMIKFGWMRYKNNFVGALFYFKQNCDPKQS